MWKTHRGDFLFANDLYVANLRPSGSELDVDATFHLSVYDVAFCPAVGPGRVAYLRDASSDDAQLRVGVTITDAPVVADFLRSRLRVAKWRGVDIEAPPLTGTFELSEITASFQLRIETELVSLTARWSDFAEPFWSDGSSPNYPYEHAWALMIGAAAFNVTLNDEVVDAVPYPDQRFRAMYGRPVSSCNVGLAEVHLGSTT